MRFLTTLTLLLLASAACSTLVAGVILEPTDAPEWEISEWINGDPGTLAAQRQKVVVILFFQLWCPGSNDFAIPLMQEWQEKFADRDDLVFISIHTVFEEHGQQTPERLRQFVAERGITHPVGIDAYEKGALVPITMDRFETGGTPHLVMVDRRGELRFSHFGSFEPEPVERFLTRLLEEKPLNIKGTIRTKDRAKEKPSRANRTQSRRDTPPPPARETEPDDGAVADPAAAEETTGEETVEGVDDTRESQQNEEEEAQAKNAELSGSYKLLFEPMARSCGDLGSPMHVITQVMVTDGTIDAKFSRPYLGVRELAASYDSNSGQFQANLQQQGTEQGGVKVDLSLQIEGRILLIGDNPEIEYTYYLDKTSEDGTFDCVIEGRGGGSRFRTR